MLKEDSILYLIPHPHFFSQCGGIGGHIAHTLGVVDAFGAEGFELDIVVGESHRLLNKDGRHIHIVTETHKHLFNHMHWVADFLKVVKRIKDVRSHAFCYMRFVTRFTPYMGLLKRLMGTLPLVVEVNSIGSQYSRWLRPMDAFALKRADIILAISDTLKTKIVSVLGRHASDRVRVLPNAVDIHRFNGATGNILTKTLGKKYIGYIGVIKPKYGLDILVKAFKIIHDERDDIELVIVGDGPYLSALQSQAGDVENIQFMGAVPFEEVPRVMKSVDALVYTSSPENYYQSPIKLYEYMASNKPVIAAETPQIINLIRHEKNGLIYPGQDPESLARGICRLVDDKELGAKLGKAAWEEISQRHSWQSRMGSVLEMLKTRGTS